MALQPPAVTSPGPSLNNSLSHYLAMGAEFPGGPGATHDGGYEESFCKSLLSSEQYAAMEGVLASSTTLPPAKVSLMMDELCQLLDANPNDRVSRLRSMGYDEESANYWANIVVPKIKRVINWGEGTTTSWGPARRGGPTTSKQNAKDPSLLRQILRRTVDIRTKLATDFDVLKSQVNLIWLTVFAAQNQQSCIQRCRETFTVYDVGHRQVDFRKNAAESPQTECELTKEEVRAKVSGSAMRELKSAPNATTREKRWEKLQPETVSRACGSRSHEQRNQAQARLAAAQLNQKKAQRKAKRLRKKGHQATRGH